MALDPQEDHFLPAKKLTAVLVLASLPPLFPRVWGVVLLSKEPEEPDLGRSEMSSEGEGEAQGNTGPEPIPARLYVEIRSGTPVVSAK